MILSNKKFFDNIFYISLIFMWLICTNREWYFGFTLQIGSSTSELHGFLRGNQVAVVRAWVVSFDMLGSPSAT